MNSAAIPALVEDCYGDDRWMCMHKRFLIEAKEREPEVVLIGDFTVAMLSHTEVIILSVGANNYENTAKEVVEGIHACLTAIRSYHPKAQIVVLKLFPCGQHLNPVREKINQINNLLEAQVKSLSNIQVVNLDPGFVQTDGTINHHDLYDYQHLTRTAYMQAFRPLSDLIQQLIREITLAVVETPTLPDE
ncbi:platelet-activating factor acetylhydrolase IB subunit beta-like isoform X2 [Limulus polyphemus]|uniref:Platelet-activating factor acetylhydrolase IB subunit beta-like isoform X2 n=1 Tax=Limulus polyphemus TaxID=6850 RepID=A0ABM1TIX2_LIMPO|nr:platelet-activating factor acetylhydrolase IB subunit beta-like isoform X2 [Limulus polyphemus]